ncbi:cysteine-rich receptor-like protein kinase 43 [Lolium rigidum]|uniref:cysteine-rich receptor-like protein kinase 43 n=1 Tax=Lolium rigidum TaxID=89674 RepID=UPI001F5CE077|nr:cysteine-rich receptor-like protein kinase 43 [Lolium rigidum]
MKPRDLLSRIRRPFSSSSSSSARRAAADARREEEDLEAIAAREQRAFRYEALLAATRGFGAKQKLGEGGFGPVYRGTLEDGREVAVKRLGAASRQGAREFRNEASLLSRVQHRNVVNLLGYCAHGADEKLLVYEYVPNESLDKILFSGSNAAPHRQGNKSSSDSSRQLRAELTWPRRHEVVVGVARGLLYLHEDAHTPIIHRDIKASNILLDDRWVAKIADFGMARLYPEAGDGRSHVQTRVAGTNGYMAPEYLMHGHLSAKADVFSFGVLVLEIVSGRKNSAFIPPPDSDADNLLDYAWKLYKKGRSMELLDPSLKAAAAEQDQVLLCIRIGLLCVQADPRLRPDMKRVVIILSKKQSTLEEPTRPGAPGSRYRRRAHGLRSSQYSDGSSSGTTPSTSAVSTSQASASASNATTATSSTHTLRSQGLPSHREGKELPHSG